MKKSIILPVLAMLVMSDGYAATLLQGDVNTTQPIAQSRIVIRDALNNTIATTTNDAGFYQVDVSNLVAPLVLSSDNGDATSSHYQNNEHSATNRVVSLVNSLNKDSVNVANLNSFTDLLVSDIAVAMGYVGPEQLISEGVVKPINDEVLNKAYRHFHQLFDVSLRQINHDPASFDPISSPEPNINALLALILHNRGYDSKSGEIGQTVLLDTRFRPITEQSPFDFQQSLQESNDNIHAKKRIFIASDSTASNYAPTVYPRMGWGQVFNQFIQKDAEVVVINGAQSGRSSRSFYNEGWFDLMAPSMQKGDYLIIAFGHNDEKCDASKAGRGDVDVKNLCTYPNDANDQKQFPAGKEDLSFQTNLERYIQLAKAKGVTPILMTPVTRFRDGNNKIAYQNNSTQPVVSTHFTKEKKGFRYWGDYAKTAKYTAAHHEVPFIDFETLSIQFANAHPYDWQNYWLAVDANDARYPYYKTQSSGVIGNPDTTHFQEKGALAMAKIIAQAVTENAELQPLSMAIDHRRLVDDSLMGSAEK